MEIMWKLGEWIGAKRWRKKFSITVLAQHELFDKILLICFG